MKQGLLISFEGPDGAGKSSVLERLIPQLEALGLEVVATREPGGVAIAEAIRSIILNPENTAMDEKTELLLYIAARRQHLKERIEPALAAGKVVLVDRFIDSTVAYQGFGRGQNAAAIDWLNQFATDGLNPHATLYFDIEAEAGLARIAQNRQGDVDRWDMEGIELHKRVREGYLSILEQEPDRVIRIDANQPLEAVVSDAYDALFDRFFSK